MEGADALTLRLLSTYVEGGKIAVGLAETLQGLQNIEAHFTIIGLQNLTTAVVPGELFSTLGVPLKKEGIELGKGTALMLTTIFLDELLFVLLCPLIIAIIPIDTLFNNFEF